MLIFDMIAAFLVATLAGLGVGGGGFFVIYLTLVRGMEQLAAQGINLFFFIAGCIPCLIIHYSKRKINISVVLAAGLPGVLGTFLGAYLLRIADPSLIRHAFGVLLCVSGLCSLFKKSK